jgi:hypothetical protein
MTARRTLLSALLAGVAVAALASPAHAQAWGDDVEVIALDEMDDLRGGFEIPGTSIQLNLGALVTTVMNGAPVLTTNITWTDTGAIVDQTMADVGQSIAELTPEERVEIGLDGLEGGEGLVISDAAGITALVHNLTEGSLQNIIINSATGRDISQTIDVTLELPGFERIQDVFILDLFVLHVSDDMVNFLD